MKKQIMSTRTGQPEMKFEKCKKDRNKILTFFYEDHVNQNMHGGNQILEM
jgi:hypothetical protein